MIMNSNTSVQNVNLNSTTNPYAWFLKDLESVPKNGLKVLTTFSCGGGSSLGYKLAGCDVIAANDIDPEMAYHYKLNLNPKYYFLCPVKDLVKQELPDELFSLDILDGSPPCSNFSMSGNREKDWGKAKHFREGQSKQVLDDLFFDYLDLAERLKPKICIAENVKGLIQGNAKGYVKLIMARFKEIGYTVQLFLVNAADCGVPQKRERVFFVALRNDIAKPKLILNPTHRWISAGDATSDLQILTDSEIRDTAPTNLTKNWYYKINPGEGFEVATVRELGRRAYFNHCKISSATPSNTLTGNPGKLTHWSECRTLTFREWKRLGSFPDDYQAKTDRIGKYMIGMSVPPRMMQRVAEAVIEQWF
jgi:DNA (cytosine-5)-methyltransferase 1